MASGIHFLDIDNPDYKRALLSVISRLKGGYSLRKFDYGYQSCYASAVVYILIGMIFDKTPEQKKDILENLLSFNHLQSSLLKSLIFNNAAQPSSIQIYDIRSLHRAFENGIVFLGLVAPNQGGSHQYGLILHYFILKERDGKYDIISSYGSYHVGISQYQTTVTAKVFNDFILSIEKPDKSAKDKAIISTFMKTYFLDTTHKTKDRKTLEDYREYTKSSERLYPRDVRLSKNTPEEVDLEVGKYLKAPTVLMLFPNIIDIFQNEINVAELKKAKLLMETSRKYATQFEKASDKARESAESLAEKMTLTNEKVSTDYYLLVNKIETSQYEPVVSINDTPSPISEVALGEVEKIIDSPSPEHEPKEADEDALAGCNFPEISEDLLQEVGFTEASSPLTKRTRSGAEYGKRKTKGKKKVKKTRTLK
jgi:hypothetical protein